MHDKKSALNKESSIERIRRAVDKLSGEVGFEKMTIRAICKEADVPVGVFYHYFKSKNTLLYDRFVRSHEYFQALYEEKLQFMDPIEALQIFTEESYAYMKSRIPQVLTNYLQAQITEYSDWVRNYAINAGYTEIPYRLFQKALENDLIETKYSLRQLCHILFCLQNGINYSYCMIGDSLSSDDTLLEYAKDWLDSLRKA